MAEEQLERSILERKERDELHAIASAMSLTPAPRSRKADIIDLILEATGVDGASEIESVGNGAHAGEAAPATRRDGQAAREAAPVSTRSSRTIRWTSRWSPIPPWSWKPPTSSRTERCRQRQQGCRHHRARCRVFDDGDTTVNPTVGDDDADGQRPRTNDRRPPRPVANREVRQSGDSHVDTANRRSRRRRGRERGDVQSGQEVPWSGELVPVKGLLDLRDEGYGFLRTGGYLPSHEATSTSRSARPVVWPCAVATPSRALAARPGRARSTRRSSASTRSRGSTPTRPGCAPASRTSRRCSRQQLSLEMPGDPENMTARIVDLAVADRQGPARA